MNIIHTIYERYILKELGQEGTSAARAAARRGHVANKKLKRQERQKENEAAVRQRRQDSKSRKMSSVTYNKISGGIDT